MRNPNAHLPKGKPCPWCGGEAQIWDYETAPRFIAVCGEVVDSLWIGPCPVKPRTERHKTRVAAAAAWDTRLTPKQGHAKKMAKFRRRKR
jgi:transcription initiation factor TFIIIB Brf1 subunit/transcription initiation factor TFIIB